MMIKLLPLSLLTALFSVTINLTNGQTANEEQAADLVKYPKHLSLEQLKFLIDSETETEFGYPSSPTPTTSEEEEIAALTAETEATWDDANTYEWTKAINAEKTSTSSPPKYPYLICHTGENMSGYQRRLAIASAINYTEAEKAIYFHTLYNHDDYLCVYGQLLASVAMNLTEEAYVVQPVLSSLKMMRGVVDGMKEEYEQALLTDGTAEGYFPKVEMGLCPGVAVAELKDDDQDDGKEDATQSSSLFVDDGEDLEGVEDITDAITNMLLSESLTNSSSTVLPLSQEFYTTSQAYIDYLNSTNTTGDNEQSERSQMWAELLDEYQTSGACDETYMTRLTWKIYRTTQPDRYASQMQVVYNNTGETDTDAGCALVLLLAISANPDVCSVDIRRDVQTSNQIASFMVESEIENERPFRARGIDGTGEVVAVSDTGVDSDHCYFYDPNESQPVGFTFDSSARKIDQYMPFVDTADYSYGHGTHVAGTIAGKRWDAEGAADGIAPGATLAVADIGNANGDLLPPSDKSLLSTGRPYAQIHSASWGSTSNFYTSRARNFDQFMFEVRTIRTTLLDWFAFVHDLNLLCGSRFLTSRQNDEFLIIVAAGNSGSSEGAFDIPNSVGDPATAKNVIAVGAHNSWGSSSAAGNLGPSYIADFSSRGPTADNRMKPDIVAVGKAVLSAGAKPDEVGECDPSKIPGPNSRDGGLLSLQGTSMATPVVSGTAALIRQYFRDGYYPSGKKNSNDAYPNPSGALVKAVLMNGAQTQRGVDNGVHGVTDIKLYDNNQGFGRLSLQDSVYLVGQTNVQLKIWDRESIIDQDTNTYDVTIDKSNGCQAEDLSVTLAWVEEGSSPGCKSCVLNDLDLSVSFRGQIYYPNGRNSTDRTNIVERVIINGARGGETATISVDAHNLAWQTQKYALVATGCFGGVANTLQGQSVFDNDNSRQRRQVIIISLCVILGVLLLGCLAYGCIRRRKARSGGGIRDDISEGEVEERA
jgi:subtilisin family serine protease